MQTAKATFRITPRGPYELSRASEFLCGFKPGAGSSIREGDRTVVGFLADGTFEPAAVGLDTATNGDIVGEVRGATAEAIRPQVARILSLDADGSSFEAIAKRDPVIGRRLATYSGFRPVCFPSPYEAAVWGVLAQRTSMSVAAKVKAALAIEVGGTIEAFGQRLTASPPPRGLLAIRHAPGVSEEKLLRLHGIARAALDGRLDAAALRARSPEEALESLRGLRGIGAWTAAHVLYRGAGSTDALPDAEPRLFRAVAQAYGLPKLPSRTELERIAERWRPLRMWVAVLLVMHLARTGGFQSSRAERSNARVR